MIASVVYQSKYRGKKRHTESVFVREKERKEREREKEREV